MPTLSIDWELSPRIIIVDAPDTEITAQEIVDTLRDAEDDVQNTNYTKIVNASGKENLGGGTFVGITVELQDAKIGFEDRTTVLESGTVTTPDTGGISLVDSTALFQTNNVAVGDLVFNETDGSYSSVTSIVSETELKTTVLSGGTDNQYDSSDAYSVYEIFQCKISGGNTVAVDDVGASLDPVFPTFGTQVVISSSSSATLQEQVDIQFASYNSVVTVDIANSTGLAVSGTEYPTGTGRQPSDNLTDALVIANEIGLFKFSIIGDATLPTGPDFSNKQFEGESENRSTITVPSAATANDCEYRSATVTGTLDGNSLVENALVSTLNFVNGTMLNSGLKEATITLGGGVQASVINCYSQVAGNGTPTISMGGSGQTMILRNYAGGIKIIDKSGTDEVSIDMNSGRVFLESSITDGEIIVRGVGKLIDNTTGTATVTNELVDGEKFQELYTYITTKLLTVAKFIGLK